jgi:hypothetical protein
MPDFDDFRDLLVLLVLCVLFDPPDALLPAPRDLLVFDLVSFAGGLFPAVFMFFSSSISF